MSRKRVAQGGAAIAAAAMFLPWHTIASEDGTDSVNGIGVSEGQLVLVVCLITIGLIQVGWRPAWIGVGLGAAIAIRAMFNDEADPAVGLVLAVAACLAATVLLVWEMFANVSAPGDGSDGGEPGGPGGRGLSGRLGRRPR